jgi:hypothetical protein
MEILASGPITPGLELSKLLLNLLLTQSSSEFNSRIFQYTIRLRINPGLIGAFIGPLKK